jgi:hypothetical protein
VTYVAELVEAVLHGDGDEHDDGAHDRHRPRRRRRQVPAARAPRHAVPWAFSWRPGAKRSDKPAGRGGARVAGCCRCLVRSRQARTHVSSLGGGRARRRSDERAAEQTLPAVLSGGAAESKRVAGRQRRGTIRTQEWSVRARGSGLRGGWSVACLAWGLGDHVRDASNVCCDYLRVLGRQAHGGPNWPSLPCCSLVGSGHQLA